MLVTPLLALRKDVLPKQLTQGWPKGPPHSASSSATASSDGQRRVQEQARGAAAPPQSAARALRLAAAPAVVWDGASLPGSARSLLEPWQTHGTGDAPREAVSHPSHAAREELAPASRRAAGLIQCPLGSCTSRNHEGVTPLPSTHDRPWSTASSFGWMLYLICLV